MFCAYDLNFKLKFVAKTEAAMAIFAIDLWSGLPYLVGARLGICSIVSDVNHFKHVLFSKFALSGLVYHLVRHSIILDFIPLFIIDYSASTYVLERINCETAVWARLQILGKKKGMCVCREQDFTVNFCFQFPSSKILS